MLTNIRILQVIRKHQLQGQKIDINSDNETACLVYPTVMCTNNQTC